MIEQAISNIEVYGPLAVVIWMFMEEFLPVPSAIAPMAAGYMLVSTSEPVNAFLTVLIVISILGSLASVISSYAMYALGFYGGKPGIEKFGGLFGVTWYQLKSFENYLTSGKQHLYIAGLRAIPLVPLSVISASAGFFRINWKVYGIWSFIGMVPRNLALGMLGWYLKEDFMGTAILFGKISTTIFLMLMATLILLFIYKREELENKYNNGKGLLNI